MTLPTSDFQPTGIVRRTTTYQLNVYPPEGGRAVAVLESASPFPSIHAGDFIQPTGWGDDAGYAEELPVARVVHSLLEADGHVTALTLVFTGAPG